MPVINNTQKNFSISTIVIFIIQISAIILGAGLIAYDEISGGFSSLAGLFVIPVITIGFPLLGILGLIQVALLLRKKLYTISVISLTITSILMITLVIPSFIASKLSLLFYPIAEKKLTENVIEKKQTYSNTKEAHYAELLKLFQKPQKIIEVQDQYLVLEDGNILKLLGFYSSRENIAEFLKYSAKYLVGKTIKIELPDYIDFSNSYIPSSRTGTFANNKYKWPKDPILNKSYGEIPVLIRIDEKLINSNYGGGNSIQKYQ